MGLGGVYLLACGVHIVPSTIPSAWAIVACTASCSIIQHHRQGSHVIDDVPKTWHMAGLPTRESESELAPSFDADDDPDDLPISGSGDDDSGLDVTTNGGPKQPGD